jgi:dihydrofolate reductase
MFNQFPVSIVVGISAEKRALGFKNQLLWHVPADLRRFKELTTGKPIIMGRKTFESILTILGKPLPNRTNIVVTRSNDYDAKGAKLATSLEEALEIASLENPTEIHIGGGAEIYNQSLPYVDNLFLTIFYDEKEADSFFPEYENDFKILREQEIQEHDGIKFQWVDYIRKS